MSHHSRIYRWIDICTSLAALMETQRESIVEEYIRLYLRHCIVLLINRVIGQKCVHIVCSG